MDDKGSIAVIVLQWSAIQTFYSVWLHSFRTSDKDKDDIYFVSCCIPGTVTKTQLAFGEYLSIT